MNQQKYITKTRTVTADGKTYTITELTPILSPEEREKRKREIEQTLYEVYSKHEIKDRKAA